MQSKLKLIKSFAGYPVGEYEYYWPPNYWRHTKDSTMIHPDIVEWMPSYFEEDEKRRHMVKFNDYYFSLSDSYCVGTHNDCRFWFNYDMFSCWNYYLTEEAAQAVSDLRKHVYKFPIGEYGDDFYYWYKDDWWEVDEVGAPEYTACWIHISATEEDRVERLRLINEVIDKVWYLTI